VDLVKHFESWRVTAPQWQPSLGTAGAREQHTRQATMTVLADHVK
jgi:hypothetical protein